MVDPSKISNFNLTDDELEEVLLFWVCAAGKNGRTTARLLGDFFDKLSWVGLTSPFETLRKLDEVMDDSWLVAHLKHCGIGNYTLRARSFRELIHSNLNLRTCSVSDLDNIIGIGPKTARAFVTHSRPNQRYAIIDTHILKYLGYLGHKVPKNTPTTKTYNKLEQTYLILCDAYDVEPHQLDLAIWNHYSTRTPGHFDIDAWKETL